jgi:hypothetical protein
LQSAIVALHNRPMNGNTSGQLPLDGIESVRAQGTTPTDSRSAGAVDLTGEELVALAFEILDDEKKLWHSGRSASLPGTSP